MTRNGNGGKRERGSGRQACSHFTLPTLPKLAKYSLAKRSFTHKILIFCASYTQINLCTRVEVDIKSIQFKNILRNASRKSLSLTIEASYRFLKHH